jgi:cytochrome c biogenesis protein CcmG/thiol:disulfide interchange protein DsbE
MRRILLWLPLLVFVVFIGVVAFGLQKPAGGPVQSKMVGKAVPAFTLPPALPGREGLASTDLASGGPRIVNIFASWCVPCIAESPFLLALEKKGIPIDAIAIRDRPGDIADFLRKYGDPYRRIASDTDSSVQLALGSSGVPETFVIDGKGVIRYQHIGGIGANHVEELARAYEAAK